MRIYVPRQIHGNIRDLFDEKSSVNSKILTPLHGYMPLAQPAVVRSLASPFVRFFFPPCWCHDGQRCRIQLVGGACARPSIRARPQPVKGSVKGLVQDQFEREFF
jgi:hypothetical protein